MFEPMRPTIALVTGAGSAGGIGFAAARRLARRGHHVVVVATSDRVHDRAADLVADGGTATGEICDLRDASAVAELVERCSAIGPLQVLVNNAGMTSQAAGSDAAGLAEHLTPEAWDDTLARNLTSAFLVCRSVIPAMRALGGGRIVNVASTTGPLSAFEGASAYAAAKAGMVGFTRALALEVAAAGITVNAVAPGWIDTPSATEGERLAGRASPVGRSGTADEVAAAIEFLASADASYVTGTMLVVDGGNAVVEDLSRSSG
ncbi:MAG: SDR family oxidoreductase [Acidimicrobiales bacterium]|nr:SDR family oxidoreductase [Acidimicrobiales bacterium]